MAITVTKEGARWIARFPFSYETKDVVKAAGFRFSPAEKLWYTTDPNIASRLDPETAQRAVTQANAAVAMSRSADAPVADIPAPDGLAYLPYQKVGITYTLSRKACLIADEMGLGKGIQSIGKINASPEINKVLVVCPASLKINWARELNKWLVRPLSVAIVNGSFPVADVVIINYDVLPRWREAVDQIDWDLVIVDEAHYAKNPRAQRTIALFGKEEKLGGRYVMTQQPIKPKQWLLLTGTPIVNRPAELWPLVHALDPDEIGKSFFGFMKRYTNAYHNGYGWDFTGAANLEELQRRMRAKFMVRRLKTDVLTDLPAKRRQVITLAPNADEQTIIAAENERYEDMVARLRAGIQISFEEMARVRHDTAVAKIPHVLEHVAAALESEDKVVVFVHHHDVARALLDAYPGAAIVTGETPVGRRQLEVDRFQHDPNCHLFIGSIKAAGAGLTLTAAQLVIFAELDWVPGNVTQAEDRLHRIGQHGSVLVQHLVFDNSVDAKMAATIVAKQEIIEQGLDRPTRELDVPEALLQVAQEAADAPTHETESAEADSTAVEPVYDEIPF